MSHKIALEHIADIFISNTIREVGMGPALMPALQRIYPFSDDPCAREVWEQALERHNVRPAQDHSGDISLGE